MAKKPQSKSKSKMRKRHLHLDVADADLKGVGLGETATITVKGKITQLEASTKMDYCGPCGDGEERWPARLSLDVASVKINDGTGNAFTKMADDDLAETDGD